MDENAVKIGGGGQDSEIAIAEIAKLQTWSRWSPFAFGTLKEIPFPTWAVLFAVLFFCLIWHEFNIKFDETFAMQVNDFEGRGVNELHEFVQTERSKNPHNPQVLIMGTCTGGLGITTSLLEDRLGQPVSKVSMPVSNIWETFAVLRKYKEETKNVRVVLVAVTSGMLCPKYNTNGVYPWKNRFQALKKPGEKYIVSDDAVSLPERYLPMRSSVRQISQSIQYKDDNTFENIAKKTLPIKQKPNLLKLYKLDHDQYVERRTQALTQRNTNILPSYKEYGGSKELYNLFFELSDYCGKNDIHLIYVHVPTCTGGYLWDKANPQQQDYVSMLSKLNSASHCSVIIADLLDDIVNCDPTECYSDDVHMVQKGATLYTNWLADQMQKNPKVMAALKTPRKPEEFFVKKYAKQSYRTIASWFKTSKPKQETEQKTALAAQPSKSPVK